MKNIKNSRFNNLIRRKTNEDELDELDYDLEENSDEQSDDKIGEIKDPKVEKAKKIEIKNFRQIGYGAAGLTIGVIAYLMLSANAPVVNQVRSTLPEFASAGQSSGYEDEFGYEGDVWNDEGFDEDVVVDEEYTGDVVPLHPFGSYRVTRTEFDEYERNETVRYGKVNPTFYFDMPAATPEDEEGQEETTGIRSETNITNVEVDDSDIDIKEELAKIDTNNDGTITIAEAEAAGYSMPIKSDFWLYKYMNDRDGDWQVGESSSDIDDAVFNTGGRSENVITGFNIHTTKTEEYNVASIREQFAKHAVLPVGAEYFNISSTYGIRVDPFTKGRAFHAGVDFSKAGISGSNIYAVMGGKITEAVSSTSKDGLGNYVVIDHGEFHTLYAHMTDGPTLKVGDVVQAGDIVGTVGSTGRSTGPHLHFEVGVGGVKFDGLEFLIHIVDKDNNGHVTIEEAKQAGFTGDIDSEHWLYSYMTKGK